MMNGLYSSAAISFGKPHSCISRKLGREDIVVVVGGVIPAQDYDQLYKDGAAAIFGPGTPIATAAIKILEILG